MIAFTLVGLIVVLLFGALRFGSRAWEATDVRAEQNAEQRLIWDFLYRTVQQTLPQMRPTTRGREMVFLGGEDRLVFVSSLPEHVGIGNPQLLRVRLEREETGGRLVLDRRLFRPDMFGGESAGFPALAGTADRRVAGSHVLLEGVTGFELAYYGSRSGSPEKWWPQWQGQGALPRLVRLRIRGPDGPWPDLVVPLAGQWGF